MSKLVIEKGVPLPALRRDNELIAALKAMEPGDSVCIPCDSSKQRNNMVSCVFGYAKKAGAKKFTTRIADGRLRIWRVS